MMWFVIALSLIPLAIAVSNPEFRRLKDKVEAMQDQMCPRQENSDKKTRILRFGGVRGDEDDASIDVFFPDEARGLAHFTLTQTLNTARSRHAAAVMGNKVVIVGGTSHGSDIKEAEAFDFTTNEVQRLTPLLYEASGVAASVIPSSGTRPEELFVCGGLFGIKSRAQCQQFNMDFSWSEQTFYSHAIPNLPSATAGAAAVTLGNYVYIIGGGSTQDTEAPRNLVHRYHVVYNTWQTVARMATHRLYPAAVANKGKIIVCGGLSTELSDLSSCEIFDPRENGWSRAAELSHAGSGMTTGLVLVDFNGRVMAVHGDSVEELGRDGWNVLAPLNDRKAFAAVVV